MQLKMKNSIIRGLTLVCFFSLISSYVAFQSGWLGTDEQGAISFNPNGTVIKPNLSHHSDTLDPDSINLDNLVIPFQIKKWSTNLLVDTPFLILKLF